MIMTRNRVSVQASIAVLVQHSLSCIVYDYVRQELKGVIVDAIPRHRPSEQPEPV